MKSGAVSSTTTSPSQDTAVCTDQLRAVTAHRYRLAACCKHRRVKLWMSCQITVVKLHNIALRIEEKERRLRVLRGGGISGRKEENCGFLAGAKVLGGETKQLSRQSRKDGDDSRVRLRTCGAGRITERARMLVAVWTSFPAKRQFQRPEMEGGAGRRGERRKGDDRFLSTLREAVRCGSGRSFQSPSVRV